VDGLTEEVAEVVAVVSGQDAEEDAQVTLHHGAEEADEVQPLWQASALVA